MQPASWMDLTLEPSKYNVWGVPVLTLSNGRIHNIGHLRNFAQNAFQLKQAVFGNWYS
jgi:hypothetical protein